MAGADLPAGAVLKSAAALVLVLAFALAAAANAAPSLSGRTRVVLAMLALVAGILTMLRRAGAL
jgi:hypothetical protein